MGPVTGNLIFLVFSGTYLLHESPHYNPGLRSNPGHVVIIFTRVAVTNGARCYECTA